jgi:photosystem II stability/assembly factor-like uncharacterized protein
MLSGYARFEQPEITFSRIDPVGGRCVMAYGSLSFGGDDFLIQDCGNSNWERKGVFRIGYVSRMFFQNEKAGLFVVSGALARIKESRNGFDVKVIRQDADERINDVFFINDSLGWACGENGIIYKTEDAGKTWERKESHTDIGLKEIKFLNAQEGWASGSEYKDGRVTSTVVVTRDGGINWSSLDTENGGGLFPIFLTGLKQGCGIDDHNDIVCSGGASRWRTVYSDNDRREVKRAIFFLNEKQGWVVGDSIWHTDDGGQTWRKQLSLPANTSLVFENVVFVNEKLGWAQTPDAVWRTTDGGKTWIKISDTWLVDLAQKSGRAQYHDARPIFRQLPG